MHVARCMSAYRSGRFILFCLFCKKNFNPMYRRGAGPFLQAFAALRLPLAAHGVLSRRAGGRGRDGGPDDLGTISNKYVGRRKKEEVHSLWFCPCCFPDPGRQSRSVGGWRLQPAAREKTAPAPDEEPTHQKPPLSWLGLARVEGGLVGQKGSPPHARRELRNGRGRGTRQGKWDRVENRRSRPCSPRLRAAGRVCSGLCERAAAAAVFFLQEKLPRHKAQRSIEQTFRAAAAGLGLFLALAEAEVTPAAVTRPAAGPDREHLARSLDLGGPPPR